MPIGVAVSSVLCGGGGWKRCCCSDVLCCVCSCVVFVRFGSVRGDATTDGSCDVMFCIFSISFGCVYSFVVGISSRG